MPFLRNRAIGRGLGLLLRLSRENTRKYQNENGWKSRHLNSPLRILSVNDNQIRANYLCVLSQLFMLTVAIYSVI